VAERRWPFARRVFIPDARDNGSYLRVTWHPESRVIVVSHWSDDDVCTAAVRVRVEDAGELVALFGHALADATEAPVSAMSSPEARSG
jgi:hypothetical protein